jgi:hypothetical protein
VQSKLRNYSDVVALLIEVRCNNSTRALIINDVIYSLIKLRLILCIRNDYSTNISITTTMITTAKKNNISNNDNNNNVDDLVVCLSRVFHVVTQQGNASSVENFSHCLI